MATTIVSTIREDGSGDFTSVVAWEAGTQRNLVSADEIEHGKIQQTWTSPDSLNIPITGWTTDATRFIILEAEGASRHNGTFQNFAGGPWRAVHVGNPAGLGVIDILAPIFIDLIGLQVSVGGNSSGSKAAYGTAGIGGLRVRMDACIGRVDANGNDATYAGLWLNGSVQLRNCLALHVNPVVGNCARGWGWVDASEGSDQNLAYNTNAIGFKEDPTEANGFYSHQGASDDVLLINCLAADCEGQAIRERIASGFAAGSDFNAADDTIAPGADGASSRNNQTFTFVNAPAKDFHLAGSDTGAKGFATDPTVLAIQPFSDDIDGDLRQTPFDIGMDQTAPTSQVFVGATVSVIQRGQIQILSSLQPSFNSESQAVGSIQAVQRAPGQITAQGSIRVKHSGSITDPSAEDNRVVVVEHGAQTEPPLLWRD